MPTGGEMAVQPEVVLGDITRLEVDVIVNAANQIGRAHV